MPAERVPAEPVPAERVPAEPGPAEPGPAEPGPAQPAREAPAQEVWHLAEPSLQFSDGLAGPQPSLLMLVCLVVVLRQLYLGPHVVYFSSVAVAPSARRASPCSLPHLAAGLSELRESSSSPSREAALTVARVPSSSRWRLVEASLAAVVQPWPLPVAASTAVSPRPVAASMAVSPPRPVATLQPPGEDPSGASA